MKTYRHTARPLVAILGFVLILALATGSATAANFYVDDDASGSGIGSWANASGDLQAILGLAADGDTVFVAQGTYKPTTGTDRSISFIPANGVRLRGSYIGYDNVDPDRRNIFLYETILSGDIGIQGDNLDNSYHVIKGDAQGIEETVFNGFIIRAGWATGAPPNDNKGGGVWVRTPMAFINSTFDSNGAGYGGAAIWTTGGAHVTVRNCIFQNGSAAAVGGAIFADGQFTPVTVNVANSLFIDNVGSNQGGAISVQNDTTMVLTNCTFSGNITAGSGSALWSQCILPVTYIRNCIIWGNLANGGSNNQVSSQTCGGGQPPARIFISFTLIEHTIHEEWDEGGNIIGPANDPQFADPDADNYRLLAISPAIDKGSNAHVGCDFYDVDDDGFNCANDPNGKTPDLDLHDRVVDFDDDMTATVDMGPYESVPCPWDLDGDCVVGAKDLLILLGDWGPCIDCNNCPADFDGDCDVNVPDLLALLGAWGPCPCAPQSTVPSLQEAVEDAGLIWPDDWDEFEDVMTDPNSSQAKKDNYYCWMDHYLNHCTGPACPPPACPDDAPFGHHE